jgi:preprotein translocase subunit SecA
VLNLAQDVLAWYVDSYAAEKQDPGEWNLEGMHLALKETFGLDVPLEELKGMGRGDMASTFGERIKRLYEDKERQVGPDLMLFHQRMIMLQIVDSQWKDHLLSIDHLKEGIGLRGYGQRDPLVEYKKESYNMFQALTDRIDEEILRWIFLYQAVPAPGEPDEDGPEGTPAPPPEPPRKAPLPFGVQKPNNLTFNDPGQALSGGGSAFRKAEPKEAQGGTDDVQTVRREGKKVGRNDPCPCGSGAKYKKCHGAA